MIAAAWGWTGGAWQTTICWCQPGPETAAAWRSVSPWPSPSMSPHCSPLPRLARLGEERTLALGVNSQLRGDSLCFWSSGRGFLHCLSLHIRLPPHGIRRMGFIRCSDNMLSQNKSSGLSSLSSTLACSSQGSAWGTPNPAGSARLPALAWAVTC